MSQKTMSLYRRLSATQLGFTFGFNDLSIAQHDEVYEQISPAQRAVFQYYENVFNKKYPERLYDEHGVPTFELFEDYFEFQDYQGKSSYTVWIGSGPNPSEEALAVFTALAAACALEVSEKTGVKVELLTMQFHREWSVTEVVDIGIGGKLPAPEED